MRTSYYHFRGRCVPAEGVGPSRKGSLTPAVMVPELEYGLSPSSILRNLVGGWPARTHATEIMKYLKIAIATFAGDCGTLRDFGEELLDYRLHADEEEAEEEAEDDEGDAGSDGEEIPRSVAWGREMEALYEVMSEIEERAQAFLELTRQQDPTMQSANYIYAEWAVKTLGDATTILFELRAIERDGGVDALRRQYRIRALHFQTCCN